MNCRFYLCGMKEAPENGLEKFELGKMFQYLIQGLLVIAPIVITLYAVYWVVSSIDNLIPIFSTESEDGTTNIRNYGLGFLLIILIISTIGYLSSYFIKNRMFHLFDSLLMKTPGIKFIYSSVKDFFEAFAGEKKKFNKPVLANIDDNDVWRMGFITYEDAADFGLIDHVAVYIPMSYSIAGNVYFLPRQRIKPVHHITSSEAMKFAISGGVTSVDDTDKERSL